MYKNGSYRISDTAHGNMLYSVDDQFIGTCLDKYGEWCYDEIVATLEYATDNVLDIGANIGTHTLAYAQRAKHVYAFEPQPALYNILCANIALNRLENAHTARTAISNFSGTTYISTIPYDFIGNFGGAPIGTGNDIVTVRKLDEYNFQDISLIKIDAEGSEWCILEGAKETIKRCKPVIYVENDRTNKREEICNIIESYGYEYRWHYAMLFRDDNYRQCRENIFPNIAGINMLCVPKE